MSVAGFLLDEHVTSSMPIHLPAYLGQGRHIPGIVQLPVRRWNVDTVADELLLILGAGLLNEFRDSITYLPLR